MAQKRILIVDDDKLVRWTLTQKCTEFGYFSLEASSGEEALRMLQTDPVDAILLDVHLPDLSGIEVLDKLKQAGETRSVIMMTADPQLDDVKAALRLGAYDFVSKPINFDELSVTLQNALDAGELRTEVETLRDQVRRRAGYHDVVGVSRKIIELMKFVYKVAASEASTILVQGESGTGKDLVSKAIHYRSKRAERPFVAINCSAIPETLMEAELFGHEKGAFTDAKAMKKGLFEVADGGTLFLDEIGELSPLLQAKLLRVLEDQVIRRVGGVRDIQVEVRVIAASNRDLEREVREGRFRQDLYYRLAIISIFLPTLRERKEDVLPLVDFFLAHYNRKFRKSVQGISEDTRRLLLNYDWPGNVRELRNALERAMILEEGSLLKPDDLPFTVASGRSGPVLNGKSPSAPAESQAAPGRRHLPPLSIPEGGTSLEDVEHALVELALQQSHGNQIKAAKLLDISRDALRYKMKKFGLGHSEEEEPAAPTNP
ncbi:MAG TPA: sigma-54 dependent transcriptional regulator [Candidatus Sulfotelmatobacter sp.]|jgi:two-component system response regulator AtoC|nr:sigma-54 dependent transcriptional regulator [Candidatus Sulfotelmatobacter sp.]